MTLSQNLRENIEQAAEKLRSEAQKTERQYLTFEGLTNELQYLQERAPIIDPHQARTVALRPDLNYRDLIAAYPTPLGPTCTSTQTTTLHTSASTTASSLPASRSPTRTPTLTKKPPT